MHPPDDDVVETQKRSSRQQREDTRRCYLLVLMGSTASVFTLPRSGAIVMGRGSESQLRLGDPSVSRRHAALRIENGRAKLVDLGSVNGTRVNDEPVTAQRSLHSGDVITIGDITLVYYGGTRAPTTSKRQAAPSADGEQATTLEMDGRTVVIADPAMARLFDLLRRLSRSDLPVLLSGETGVGKENAAFALHFFSPRARCPFVAINCAALHETLAESELFGHEKGAFSGASAAKIGLIEAAHGGTLFFDEIGELPLAIQAKLLRVLETKRLTRVGDVREREVDLRIVAATNRDLEREVHKGGFRKDLFFRLSVASVVLPPLRQRLREVPILARTFLEAACQRSRRLPMTLSPAAVERLVAHDWPGNVRELRNLMEYLAATLAEDAVEPKHLPVPMLAPQVQRSAEPDSVLTPRAGTSVGPQHRSLSEEIRAMERTRMLEALRATGGRKKLAAEMLNMPIRTFSMKAKQYGIG